MSLEFRRRCKHRTDREDLLDPALPWVVMKNILMMLCNFQPWEAGRGRRRRSDEDRYRWVPSDSKEPIDELTEIKFPASDSNHSQFQQSVKQFISDGSVDDIKSYSDEHGLNFDDADIKFYVNLFEKELKRKPTKAELHDLANSNSEHSRHHLFRAK